jgi:hypothetical protein
MGDGKPGEEWPVDDLCVPKGRFVHGAVGDGLLGDGRHRCDNDA